MMAVAIVGGGITGLVLGRELDRAGVEFVLLEAADRPGGVIRSAEVEGRVLDWGPQRARLTRPMAALVEEVGLAGEVVTAPPGLGLFVYRGGRLRRVPFSLAELVRSDVVSLGGKLRLLREPFTAGPRPGERVSAFFERKLGREFYETVVAPLYGGLYASDPADMEVGLSLLHVLREVGAERSLAVPLLRNRGRIDPPAACTFRGGMAALPLAVAATLGDRLRLKAPVVGLERTGTGWRLSLGEEPAAQASGPASWEARGTPRPAGPDTLEAEVVVQ